MPLHHTAASTDDIIMALIGMETLAYIRPIHSGYGVFAADGTQLAVFESEASASLTIRQNNLELVSIH